MTRCETIATLLPDVADGEATPADAATVARHVGDCTHCRIQLARERRLSAAIRGMREVDVDGLFTAAVLERIPATLPERRRHRRGLKLAVIAGLVALVLGLAAPHGLWGADLPSPAAPGIPADVADPAAGGLATLTQSVVMAVQAFLEAPLIASALGLVPLPLLLAAAFFLLAGMALGSTLLVLLAGAYCGGVRPLRSGAASSGIRRP